MSKVRPPEEAMAQRETNSKHTRVQPVFGWLEKHGGTCWSEQLLRLASGLTHPPSCGAVRCVHLEPEAECAATPARLAWMIRNVDGLVPQDGRRWRQLRQRVEDAVAVQKALSLLNSDVVHAVPKTLVLEGKTHADCLIECERALIWIEGKRYDWLASSTKWDVSRDQLARNLEAVWWQARGAGKDYCLIICHEYPFKYHEQLLIRGYRQGTWNGGWPHLDEEQRAEFSKRIGTITWTTIAREWPALRMIPELDDLSR